MKSAPVRSLVHVFEPDEGYKGVFGWLCGYSADAPFLELAAERFSRLTPGARSSLGRVFLLAMLDPGNPQLRPTETPGVLHAPWRSTAERRFALLHAKVAVLGFAHESDPARWVLRLVVSTGNWTRQTVEESLDAAWVVDVHAQDVAVVSDATGQSCAELSGAWGLLRWLRDRFDVTCLATRTPGHPPSETSEAMAQVERWVGAALTAARGTPRFFDSRESSLLAQLAPRVRSLVGGSARNYLALVSGFYEEGEDDARVPRVLEAIVSTLRAEKLLTASADVDVFVNPAACQAVARCHAAMDAEGWTIRGPGQPAYMGPARRTLHAKLIVSLRSGDKGCASGWVYLGSGNLTTPGFRGSASTGGNLEAGVIIDASDLRDWDAFAQVLPLQWEHTVSETDQALSAGEPWEGREAVFVSGPVSCFRSSSNEDGLSLEAVEPRSLDFELEHPLDGWLRMDPSGVVRWSGDPPRQVRVRWHDGEADVPVVDEHGRVAGAALPTLDLEGVWVALANFPVPMADDEAVEDDVEIGVGAEPRGVGTTPPSASLAIREVMVLLERVAARQSVIPEHEWPAWCVRMEQTFLQASGHARMDDARALGLNLLEPLREPAFRPSFARDRTTSAGELYEAALDRIEHGWKMDGLASMGGTR